MSEKAERKLDEELKMAVIRYYDEMARQSAATIEKIRAQVEQIKIDNERYQKEMEVQNEQRKLENERFHKENERLQRESEARIAKYEAERDKINKDTKYYPLIALIIAAVAAAGTILSPILRHYFH